jgi:putative ATPase
VATLFPSAEDEVPPNAPLAERLRPRDLADLCGQEELTGEGRILRRLIEADRVPSMILWGPPGSGKTTLARILARHTGARFVFFSAVLAGKEDVRRTVEEAQRDLFDRRTRTILFVDEIHRFNKAQQDAFLPHVEAGTIVLVGATTENPSFEVNAALLSRLRVFVLKPLGEEALRKVLARALADPEAGLGARGVRLDPGAERVLVASADGDARRLLNLLEAAVSGEPEGPVLLTEAALREALQRKTLAHDRGGEEHYNLISALHKSLRGSDPQASAYWLGRLLIAGEDPLYVARRLVRFASEDVGLADPQALVQAIAAKEAVHFVGMPEGGLALLQAAIYLATAPKSNALYEAYGRVAKDVAEHPAEPVPLSIRNAPTDLMARLGYGEGYKYPHDYVHRIVAQGYLPDGLSGRVYYRPGEAGFEREVKKRLDYWEKLRREGREEKRADG